MIQLKYKTVNPRIKTTGILNLIMKGTKKTPNLSNMEEAKEEETTKVTSKLRARKVIEEEVGALDVVPAEEANPTTIEVAARDVDSVEELRETQSQDGNKGTSNQKKEKLWNPSRNNTRSRAKMKNSKVPKPKTRSITKMTN